jgi:hypothetical protein
MHSRITSVICYKIFFWQIAVQALFPKLLRSIVIPRLNRLAPDLYRGYPGLLANGLDYPNKSGNDNGFCLFYVYYGFYIFEIPSAL